MERVAVAHYRIWDHAAGLWRHPPRKALREHIRQRNGVPLHDTEEWVPANAIDAEGWYVPRDGADNAPRTDASRIFEINTSLLRGHIELVSQSDGTQHLRFTPLRFDAGVRLLAIIDRGDVHETVPLLATKYLAYEGTLPISEPHDFHGLLRIETYGSRHTEPFSFS